MQNKFSIALVIEAGDEALTILEKVLFILEDAALLHVVVSC